VLASAKPDGMFLQGDVRGGEAIVGHSLLESNVILE
jgi:hypothetical protein